MTNPYGIGVMTTVYEITEDGRAAVALVWQTDLSSAELIAEFTARFGGPIGESVTPFDITSESNPESLIITYDGGAA